MHQKHKHKCTNKKQKKWDPSLWRSYKNKRQAIVVIRATPAREEARSGCQGVEIFYSCSFRSIRCTKCEADNVHRKRRIAAVERSTKESQVTAGKTRLWRGKKKQQKQTLLQATTLTLRSQLLSLSPALFFLPLSLSLSLSLSSLALLAVNIFAIL